MKSLKAAGLWLACALALVPIAAGAQPRFNPGGIPAYDSTADALRTYCVDPSTGDTVDCGPIDPATETTLQALNANITGLRTELATPADSLPPPTPVASTDTTLSQYYAAITVSGDTTLIGATALQSTRVHALECSIIPTSGDVTVTFKSGATTLRAIDFKSIGGILRWEYRPYRHLKTANNEPLVINFSTAGAYKCWLEYVKGA